MLRLGISPRDSYLTDVGSGGSSGIFLKLSGDYNMQEV